MFSSSSLFKEGSVDFYLLPQRDRFLDASPHAQKIITDFTGFRGSTSTLVITPHEKYLFVDGRYEIQAKKQVFNVEIVTQSLFSWLSEKVHSSHTVMLNPWHWSVKNVKELTSLLPCSFLYESYCKQEQEHKGAIFSIEDFSSFQKKCQKIFPLSQDKQVLLCKSQDSLWLTDLRSSDLPYTPVYQGYTLIGLTPDGYEAKIFTSLPRQSIPPGPFSFYPLQAIESFLKGRTILYDPSTTPYALLSLNGVTWEETSFSSLQEARSRKTEKEISQSKKAHEQDGVALTRFLHAIDHLPKDHKETDWSLTLMLEEMRRHHPSYQGPSFASISGSGATSAMIHYLPSQEEPKRIEEGLYLIDSGGQYHFGTTDITRTVWLGSQEPNHRVKKIFTAVLQGHIQVATLIFPKGTLGSHLDAIARSFLWQRGLDYPHSTGHGVGLYSSVHEYPPSLSLFSHCVLEEGMILSNEPGYYEEGWGGIRLENLFVIQDYNPRSLCLQPLSLAPFDTSLILMEELSHVQRQWLETYHKKVYTTLSPFLEVSVVDWLRKTCFLSQED